MVKLILGTIVAVNATFAIASPGEGGDGASASAAVGHDTTFSGIPGCDVNLERVGGSVGVGLYQKWKATAAGSCPADPVYEFSLRGAGETAFAMKRDFATRGSAVDSLARTNWIWTPMVPGDYQVRVVVKAAYGYVEEIGADASSLLPTQGYTYVGREPTGDAAAVGGRNYRASRVRSLYSASPP